MLDLVMPAAFQDIGETDDIGVDVIMRMIEGVAHAGLRGEMDNSLRTFFGEQRRQRRSIGDILLDEAKPVAAVELFQAGKLQPNIIIVVEIVYARDLMPAVEQRPADVEADKSRCTRNQNP